MNASPKSRITSLDLLRGLVMIIMALDHTRDFFHFDAFLHDPLDLSTTSVSLYFTRWITHFCAPVFVFLAGTSVYLQGLRKTKEELSGFLFKRGIWLIFIELIVINFSWSFDVAFRVFILQVIWAIGISMVLLGAIIRLPFNAILVLGLLIVSGHNIFDSIKSTHQGFWWDLLRNGNFAFHEIGGGRQAAIIYPFVPWLGLMMLGYCFGKLYEPSFDAARRNRLLTYLGFGLIVLFVALRWLNAYGNPFPWSAQNTTLYTFLSFINVHKYPPSLLFVSITIGPALLFLSVAEKVNSKFTQAISVFGRVPFFYYVLHFYLLHFICMILFLARGHSFSEQTPDIFGIPFKFMIAGEGYSLGITYLIWMLVVLSLYPLCKWFSTYKKQKGYWWLGYL